MKKRILSIFLAVCMLFTLLPVGALAEETTVTRAEWIQSLVKTFDMTVEEGAPPENYYSDLTGDETYYRDILVAAEFGVIDTPAGEAFEPNEPATREFAAQTLNFCLGFQLGEDKQYTYSEYETVDYPDDIQVAVNRGWFALENGSFLPQQALTVAESEAMLKDASTVLSGNTVNENYDSTYTFEKDVIVIPEGTTVGVSDDTVTITDSPKTIAAGQMFAVYINGIPQAFVANSVSVSGNITTVQGTPTDDAFAAIDAQGVVTAELDQVEALEGTDLSYYVEETEKAYETYDMAKAAQRRAIGGTIKPKNISLSFKHDVTISSSIKGTISGKIKNPVIKYNINLAKGKALVSLAYDVDVTYTLKGEVSGVKSLNDIKLFYWGVPGVGGFSVTFDMELSGSIKSVQSSHEERGLSVSVKDGVQMTKSFEAKSFSIEIEATARAGIQAKAGITELPVFNVYIYGKVGMEAKLKSATYSDSASPKRCTHFAAYLYAECGATGSVKLLSFKNSFDLKYTIFSEKNSPIRICHHYEDGKLVSDCTRGNVSAWFDGNGFSGYHTPSDSSYMSSGWSGGSGSVGYDRNGKPKTLYTYTLDDYKNATITEYNGNARSLSVPKTIDGYTVVGIGSSAFKGNTNLRFLSLPDTVTKIDSNAFSDCTSLSKVNLPDSLTTIENCAFNNCESLEEVHLPDGLTAIGFRAFGACTSLKKVYIPKTITSCAGYNPSSCVWEGPFRGCTSLNDVEFADGIKTIPQNMFLKCTGLKEIIIPDTVTTIGSSAFEYCSNLTSVVWSNKLTTIGSSAFYACTKLAEVTLPDTVTKIDSNAFSDCTSLSKVNLPDSLTTIENCAFNNCESLEEVHLPDGLTAIGFRAFGACTSLKKVYIPKTITSCAGYNPSSCVWEGPFRGCTSLNDVEFADGIKTIPQNMFLKCTGLKEIIIPDTVTTIGSSAFEYCSNLTSVVWSNKLTTIGSSAFYACTKLAEVTLPDTVTKIDSNAFSDCTSLSKVNLPDSLTTMEDEAFCNCSSLKELKLSNSMSTIPGNAFTGCSALEELVIPDSVTTIEEKAFMNCSALKTVSFGKELTAIYNNAFDNCVALDAVVLPESLKTIYYNAFRDCNALTEITIPNNVTSIGNSAFYDCDSLAKVTISNSVTSMGTYVFYNCDALTDVQLGTGITTIPENTFNHCDALASIVVPRRVTTIGNYAFKDCVKFTEITIPRAVTSISANAFSYPAKMTIYGVAGTYAETFANDNSIKFVDRQVNATSATLDKTTLNINKGSSAKLNLSVQPLDFTDEVNWKSANTSVVTVAADGTVKAVGVGTTTIKVTVGNASASCKVTVVQPVTSISLNKTSLSMEALSTYQLTATAYPNDAYDKSVKWESSDTSVATVSEDGMVTAVGKGTATIKATSTAVSSVSRSCTVTVTNNGIVAKDVAQLESPHNYSNNCSDIWLYTLPDASKITVTFDERTNIEDGFDYLYIYNASGEQVGKYTGTELAGKSIDIDGDTVKIKLVSDGGGNEWGFKVTDVKVASGAHVHSCTSVVTAPSCTEKGYTTHTCTCGDSYVDSYTDALGHSYGAWKQTKAPTCTEKGMETRTCTRCNASETRDINALGHDIKHHAAKAATCTEKGWAAYDTCSRCNYSTYKEIAATGHKHNAVVTAPTCTAKGYTTHTCACGDSYKDSYTNALGHNYANGKCTRCGAADPNYNPAPAAPELKITTVSGKPKISWNAVDGAVKYWIYRSTDGKTFKYYDSTTKTSYTNNSTTIGTTYYYKVKAVNVVDGKNYASAYSVSKGIQCKPAAPTVSINRSNGKPKLSWKAVSGATKYWIYRSTDGVNFKYWDSTTKTSYTNSGAASGTKYYYRVKAVAVVNGKNIVSANSSTKSLFTSLAKPSVSITTSNGKPKLTWKAVTGADKYYIYRSTDGKNFSYWDSTTKTTYVNSGAKKNTKYYYKVKAVCASNSNANSAQSSTVSIKATK